MDKPLQPDTPPIAIVTEAGGATTLYIDDRQAMQAWERDLMHRSADLLCQHGDHFLEVGLGLGISALRIASHPNTRAHLVVEKYQRVIDLFRTVHPTAPRTLEIVHADFLDFIRAVPRGAFDGIFFDPYLPPEMRNDEGFWDGVMPVLTRALRPGGVFIPCFTTRPTLYWARHFTHASVERHPYAAYENTEYTAAVSGDAYIQCYYEPVKKAIARTRARQSTLRPEWR